MQERALITIETELREVIMDVRDCARSCLLGFSLGRTTFPFPGFRFCIELFGHALGPFERNIGVVCPIPL